MVPHFFHVREQGRTVIIEDYIPRCRKHGFTGPGDSFVVFDGMYRVRIFEQVGIGTADTLFGAYRQALIAAKANRR